MKQKHIKVCPICQKKISNNNYSKHKKSHEAHPEYQESLHNRTSVDHEVLICKYCSKECKNKNSLAQHEIRCSSNPNKKLSALMFGNKGFSGHTKLSEHIEKWRQTYFLNKVAGYHKDTSGENNTMSKCPDAHLKISQTCLEKSGRGEWHTSLAKNHHYSYKGADLHCKWELLYAQWLDDNHITWERTKDRFEYYYKEKLHYYTPDFYLSATDEYVEIKGYVTGKDYAKWRQFPKNLKLTVLKQKQLVDLGIKVC